MNIETVTTDYGDTNVDDDYVRVRVDDDDDNSGNDDQNLGMLLVFNSCSI